MTTTRLVLAASTTVLALGLLSGCAAKQVPPAEGVCNPGREWVAPRQDERGRWVEGYCRNVG